MVSTHRTAPDRPVDEGTSNSPPARGRQPPSAARAVQLPEHHDAHTPGSRDFFLEPDEAILAIDAAHRDQLLIRRGLHRRDRRLLHGLLLDNGLGHLWRLLDHQIRR
ncbi:hypothetical protein ACFWOJ_33395 [Streptomyces sp. NPDC058439]|uniref:hypothetical protein n=1 Tax=Streptomyces sp. NPDC058439 TaxID=3346500 RepID=UPI003646B30A